mgnify:CR=1 FL=1
MPDESIWGENSKKLYWLIENFRKMVNIIPAGFGTIVRFDYKIPEELRTAAEKVEYTTMESTKSG